MAHHPGCPQRNDPSKPCNCITKHGRPPRKPSSPTTPNNPKNPKRPGGPKR